MKPRFPLNAGLLLLALLAACGAPTEPMASAPVHLTAPDGRTVTVWADFAETPVQQEKGLMGRPSLPQGSGMLFVFPKDQILSFWMKDTLIPLDITFFDGNGRFVSGLTMPLCGAEENRESRCPRYLSAAPARYALEVPEGFLRLQGIKDGWKFTLNPWNSP